MPSKYKCYYRKAVFMAPLLNDILGRTQIIIIRLFEQVMAGFKCFQNNITLFMFNPLSKTR